ncbi:MAG: trigger factor [Bacteroidales bacterium]|nr:trigger factor [Bacteroidales bacterium]
MTINRENIDELNALLKVNIVKADYEEKVEKVLRDYRKKANVKGFRPGMVPIGLIRKMYGKAVKIDEINKTVSENIQKYLTDEKLDILGDPLPVEEEYEKFDFDSQDDFTFSFELGLAPSFEIKLNKKNKVTSYEIKVDDKMKNDYIDNYRRRYGQFIKADISEEKDLLKGKIEAVDEAGNPLPEGPAVEDTSLAIDFIKDPGIKELFTGKKVSDTVIFDLRKAFPNENEIAGILRTTKDSLKGIDGLFRFTINEISRFTPAEINQELFDKIYGEGSVNSEEEFNKKIEEEISLHLKQETDFKLAQDIKKLAIEKTDFQLPEAFLKKWLLKVNDKTTAEQIEKEFDTFRKDLKWQLIRNKLAKQNEIKITEEELLKEAEEITRNQFRQYGLFYATEDQVTHYAKETLKREEDARRIADKLVEDKIIALLKDTVKIETESVTVEQFNKLFE